MRENLAGIRRGALSGAPHIEAALGKNLNGRTPIFNAPPSVTAALAMLAGVHLARQALPEDTDAWAVLALAFIPARYNGYGELLPGGPIAAATSFFSHALVHANAAHLMLNGAWLLVFGAAVAARIGGWRFFLFAFGCAAAGAALFLAANPGLGAPMIGASGAVAGLMGATFRFLFGALDQGGLHLLRTNPRAVRLTPLSEVWRDRRILTVTALWFALNALSAFGVEVSGESGAIAWEAHIGGYAAGFLGLGLFEPRREKNVAAPDNSL